MVARWFTAGCAVRKRTRGRAGRPGLHQGMGYVWPRSVGGEVGIDQGELVEGGLQVLDDLGGDDVGIGEVGGVLEALVAQPEDVEVGLVALRSARRRRRRASGRPGSPPTRSPCARGGSPGCSRRRTRRGRRA